MATLITNGMVVRARTVCYDNESQQVSLNIVVYQVIGVVGPIFDTDIASALAAAHAPPYKAWMSSQSVYSGVGVQVYLPNLFPEVISNGGTGVGVAGSTQLPTQVSGLIRFSSADVFTGTTGNKYIPRGRIYPGFPATLWGSAQGQMTAPGLAALNAIRLTYPLSRTVVVGVNSCQLSLHLRITPMPFITPVASSVAFQKWATQRRRGDFGRTNPNPIP